MHVYFLSLILFGGSGYISHVIPVPLASYQECLDRGAETGYAKAEDNPPIINGRPNPNVPLKMWTCGTEH